MTALRFMIEDGAIGGDEVAEVREVVRTILTGRHLSRILGSAIELAPVLGDAGLWETVETRAVDREAVEALTSTNLPDGSVSRFRESRLDWVQANARGPHRSGP